MLILQENKSGLSNVYEGGGVNLVFYFPILVSIHKDDSYKFVTYGRGQITAPGRFPYSFREACEIFRVPRIGLVKVERLGQWLNIPTQGRRVAQTGTKLFSLTAQGSDPQPGIEPRPHW